MIDFGVMRRERLPFHYSRLDGQPIVRRLTLNGSEGYDHLSREAQLDIKDEGVYYLNSNEDKGHAIWRFEYLVEECRGKNGKTINGERVRSSRIAA
jgi:hypothetical protein